MKAKREEVILEIILKQEYRLRISTILRALSGLSRTCKMESFATIGNYWKLLTIAAKLSTLVAWGVLASPSTMLMKYGGNYSRMDQVKFVEYSL